MSDKLFRAVVKHPHGSRKQHQPGDTIVITEAEAIAFKDKFSSITEIPAEAIEKAVAGNLFTSDTDISVEIPEEKAPHPFDGMTARDLIAGLRDNAISPAEAIAYELEQSKPRVSVLREAGYDVDGEDA